MNPPPGVGVTLDPATGVVSGTTFGVTGTTGFSVTATDAALQTATRSYVLTFMQANPALPTLTLSHGTVGVPYGTSIQASGTAPITYTISVGALPPGLSQSGKNVGGTPTQVGTYTFTVSAANDHTPFGSGSDTHVYTIVIDPAAPVMTGLVSPGGATVGTPYSYTVTPSSGTGPYTFAVTSGTLPAGLTLNSSTGVISGTATAGGSSTFTVSATNSAGTASSPLTIVSTVVVPGLGATTVAPTGNVGSAYTYTVAPSGSGPFTFAVSSGSLPAGLTFNTATGVISGTPTTAGIGSFSVTATNSAGSATTAVTLPVVALPVVAATMTLPVASTGSAYSGTVSASGAGLSFALANGSSLPAGLSLNPSTGAITGTSTTPGTSTFTVNVTNGGGTVSTLVTLVTQTPPTLPATATAPTAAVGSAYSYTVAPAGTGPFTYAITGTLPAGLSLNTSTGVISGTATTAGIGSFAVTATNSAGSATTAITLPVQVAPTLPATTSLASGVLGIVYSQSLAATGTGPFTYSVVSGSLPAGLSLNPNTGAVFGTPTAGANATFVVQATNGAGSATTTVSLAIAAPPGLPAVTTSVTGSVGTPYSATLAPSGTGPFTYAVTAGSLPAGLTLNTSTGVISGTPSASGVGTFSVTATNSLGSATTVVTLPVLAAPSLPSVTPVPTATVGVPYSASVAPAGSGSLSYTVTTGSLPTGLALNSSSGTISGTPTATGTSTVAITATNAGGGTASTSVTLPIVAAPVSSGGVTSAPVTSAPVASAPVTSAPATSAPASSAPVASAPVTSAPVTSTPVTATPAVPAFTMTVPTAPTVGGRFSMTPIVTPGSGAVTFSIAGGALPAGVKINTQTGAITGRVKSPGVYRFSVRAANRHGVAVRQYAVVVTAPTGSVPDAKLKLALALSIKVGAAAPGAPVSAVASGLLPGAEWSITMHSKPVVIASGTTPASGSLSTTAKLPSHIPAGSHRLILTGTSMTGTVVTSEAWFTVTAAKSISGTSSTGPVKVSTGSGTGTSTGFAALPWLGGAGAVLLLGLGLVLVGRRRRDVESRR